MIELKNGESVSLTNGSQAKVVKELVVDKESFTLLKSEDKRWL